MILIFRPDALHWLGITKIHKFISMSDMKYDAIINSGIKIVERIPIPPELIPKDAQVEIAAKVLNRCPPVYLMLGAVIISKS